MPRDAAESPPPERQTGAQQHDPTGPGTTRPDLQDPEGKAKELKAEIDNLESNPKQAMADELPKKFSKGVGN
ncbi:hypothetical protein GMORB2_7042 [Geosmithia morbida]|uniref:Uncharacterized protein n=1 Tax=Geosmithia morbida TaxID=1094350 RepID=A0A9P5D4F2_9HYPO|nr:uncharacterized protein GMORB2_7042 [Geosmithia morbida]KAF4122735.1 hypothetical protein GMORB2_7042 [Geosmithia morbida]